MMAAKIRNFTKSGDLVFCKIERRSPNETYWMFQEVLAVDPTGAVTHIRRCWRAWAFRRLVRSPRRRPRRLL